MVETGGEKMSRRIKVLIAKPGLDGHDRGAKIVAHALRDAGFEVAYTGLHQTVDKIVDLARWQGVDVIGLSIMSGAHVPICDKLMKKIREEGLNNVLVVVGGVIPKEDVPILMEIGIQGVFPGGTPLGEIVSFIEERVQPES